MENEKKVFSSNITRSNNNSKNNLYDILNIDSTQPLPEKTLQNRSFINHPNCSFIPKSGKIYLPKKKNIHKVKTVRDIRRIFERDVYSYLPAELERQKNTLLRKISFGCSRDEKTKEYAKSILKGDAPITKSAWQMVMNINPEEHKFSSQYILWKGKCIQVNGSTGEQYKFIYKYDIGRIEKPSYKKLLPKSNVIRKRRLLQHSLNVKFKPGPLSKKKDLDISYQKYQFGEIELVNLPKAGLIIQTSYGKPLAPVIDTFLNKSFSQNDNGLISQQWAMFAVTAVGKNINGTISQMNEDSCVTFDLQYKCIQRKMLMRHDSDIVNKVESHETTKKSDFHEQESTIISEIKNILDSMLKTVEISLTQDDIQSGEDEIRETIMDNTITINNHSNTKNKRKFGELGRLDVTVIRISDRTEKNDASDVCQKDYCALGCICDSLKCSYNLKNHCGRLECMFKCKCDFSKYKYMNSFVNDNVSDYIPGLVNLDKKLGETLTKEEHKFHQTVIVTNDKSIVLKSDKRHWKTSKKYADFYSNMHLKTNHNANQVMSVVCQRLDLKNIEPWCMVHNLYKCFCKGKFTESGQTILNENKAGMVDSENPHLKLTTSMAVTLNNKPDKSNEVINCTELTNEEYVKRKLRSRSQNDLSFDKNSLNKLNISNSTYSNKSVYVLSYGSCARVKTYNGRKYNDVYYHNTHTKISEMEKNDKSLQKKMMTLIGSDEDTDKNIPVQNIDINLPLSLRELLSNIAHTTHESEFKEQTKRLPNKTKLVAWLESNYKQYKQRLEQGLVEFSLAPPQAGKMCLYSWDFILSRYRERKNYFLISKQRPFRIFMAVNTKSAVFQYCSDISDITLSDMNKYPLTVKNLLTNATDLKESFCILCGLLDCWELIGSVTKVRENENSLETEGQIDQLIMPDEKCSPSDNDDSSYDLEEMPIITNMEKGSDKEHERNNVPPKTEISKWFVMAVSNDFSEIQFIHKGFFVKYDNIVKAINVARVTGKTVRLSSKTCNGEGNDLQFGVYAMPSINDFCVFIGPYDLDENLGIETIKNVESIHKNFKPQLSKGVWITTNKVDNLNVIDDPSMFIPSNCLRSENMITLESDSTINYNTHGPKSIYNVKKNKIGQPSKVIVTKQIKPIKIRKTNGFYHLASNGSLTPLQSPEKDVKKKSSLINNFCNQVVPPKITRILSLDPSSKNKIRPIILTKPIAEIAPQIKEGCGENNLPLRPRKLEGGMCVLKPEEINKRSFEKQTTSTKTQESQNIIVNGDEMSMDIEKFLESSVICSPPKEKVYIISDDESEDSANSFSTKNICKDVWIICKNIDNLGWIAGKRNSENHLSFEFPGFKFSKFYPEKEAFMKISQTLARKIYVPKHITLEWHVVQSEAEIKESDKLQSKYLCADYILTKSGLWNKCEVMEKLKSLNVVKFTESSAATSEAGSSEEPLKKKCKIATNFEQTSNTLEEESSFLWNKTITRRGEILDSFSTASEEFRRELTEQLKCIRNDSED